MMAFRFSAERLMLEITEVVDCKASADVQTVRKSNIATNFLWTVSDMDATHLPLRSNRQRLERGRTLCQAANGRTTSSTPTAGRANWSQEASAPLDWSQETKSGPLDLSSCPRLGHWSQHSDIVYQAEILSKEFVSPKIGKRKRRQYRNVGTMYEAPE